MSDVPESRFTWVPLYTEIGKLLVAWESRQGELIQFLESLRSEGIVVTPLEDRDKNGETHLLREIDPFTFLGTFNRGIRDAERLAILSRVKTLLGASSPLPQDFFGVPLLNNQRSWFINYEADRGVNDVKKLWEVFRLAQPDDATKTQEFPRALDAAWEVQGVATNLTMGLFWIRPDRYLNLDQVNRKTYSYEDFIRGYRPLDGAGTFGLQDSVFYKFCMRAQEQIDLPHVFIIDEINRGNLSQIFGELLMLIESDKRGKEYAVPLVYQRPNEPRFFVPENVHIIGLMNIADRSLAIVDYALRRRFSFKTLKPQYGSPFFRSWLHDRRMEASLVNLVIDRMARLNQEICEDPLLGENFQVGHSFFCPNGEDFSELKADWFFEIVESEIVPLLKEYWFDNPKQVTKVEEWLRAR